MTGHFCVETCWRILAEPKLSSTKPTLPNANSLRIVPTTMKLQTVSIRVPQNRKTISAPINPSRKCAQCEQHIFIEEKALAWEAMEFCNEDCLSKSNLLVSIWDGLGSVLNWSVIFHTQDSVSKFLISGTSM